MRFYTQQHRHYCGIDLHARSLLLGTTLVQWVTQMGSLPESGKRPIPVQRTVETGQWIAQPSS
jgi:hypothetical protein